MNFDPVARHYGWLERIAFFGALQRCRLALLPELGRPVEVLILGEGTGRFLEAVVPLARNITVIDSSRLMIRRARQRVRSASVRFIEGDAREILLADQTFDLIVTHFFLDCFTESDVARLVAKYRERLDPGGRWLWSDFAVLDHGLMKWPSRWVVRGLYRFFEYTCGVETRRLVDAGTLFESNGMQRVSRKRFMGGLLESALWHSGSD